MPTTTPSAPSSASSGQSRVELLDGAVRRPAGPWTGAVHGLLAALPDGIGPRPLGLDGDWETVTRIDGVVGERPLSDDVRSDDALVSTARLLRAFHEAAPGWRHNDVGPWNVVFQGRRAAGLIDWDLAGPGPAVSDAALAVWHFAPLYDDAECVRIGWPEPPDRLERARRFCAAYGSALDQTMWEAIGERMRWYRAQVVEAHASPGSPGAVPWLKVDVSLVDRDMAFVTKIAEGATDG